MSSFLENLKKAVDTGEFNSDAAKKIVEIDKLAGSKINSNEFGEKSIDNNIIKTVTPEEAVEINSIYEEEMRKIKLTDIVNKKLATLIEIEELVMLSIEDLFGFIDESMEEHKTEFEENNPIFTDLSNKITEIRTKYNTFINK